MSASDFLKSSFSKYSFSNTIRVSKSFDPDRAGQNSGSDLDPNCLQRLSVDDTSRQQNKGGTNKYQNLMYWPIDACINSILALLLLYLRTVYYKPSSWGTPITLRKKIVFKSLTHMQSYDPVELE